MMTTLKQQVAELRRELAVRQRKFPEWVRAGSLPEKTAEHRIACLRDLITDLESRLPKEPEQGDFLA